MVVKLASELIVLYPFTTLGSQIEFTHCQSSFMAESVLVLYPFTMRFSIQ